MAEYFVGVDVSKGYADFAAVDGRLEQVDEVFRLDDVLLGHQALEQWLQDLCARDSSATVYIGMESTGGLEVNWLKHVRQLGGSLPLHSVRLNPVGVAQYVKADQTRTVTDAVSALKIAEYLCNHRRKVRFDEEPVVLQELRPLWSLLTMLKKQRAQLTNNLHRILYGASPSLLVYCRRGFPDWVIEVVRKYPTARKLAAARVKSLTGISQVTEERATKLIAAAKQSVGACSDATAELAIRTSCEQILHLDKTITAIQKDLIAGAKPDARFELLCSFPGIGELSAVGLMMNMPSLRSTPDASHLASYWGLHPVFKTSGDGRSAVRMSKAGRSQARAILFMVAMAAICHNPLIKALYRRLVYKKGMKPLAALGVCMHKIARIVYGMLSTNTPFDAAKDLANSTKPHVVSPEQAMKNEEKRRRRYQAADEAAPISKREKKRRERVNGSQCTCGTECGITATPSPSTENALTPA